VPTAPLGSAQVLSVARQIAGYVTAADMIGYRDSAFVSFISSIRTYNIGNQSRWYAITQTSDDTSNNWGAVGRYCWLLLAAVKGDQTMFDNAVAWFRRYLGETPAGTANFVTTSDYRRSWDNGTANVTDGTGLPIAKGVGQRDVSQPGLDGVVIEDAARGVTDYNSTISDGFGATGSGRTYPLEALEYVWSTTAVLRNAGYDPLSWGDQAVSRACVRVAVGGDMTYAESSFGLYRNDKWFAERIGGASVGTKLATNSGTGGLLRSLPPGDWLCDSASSWMV
jgi:hypothetical protein